tara:strand:+ start:231 stop:515 length:285 start_codon:yes stop_codon:yes gene_type:complete
MQRISRGTKRDMTNLDMTVEDIQELFRVMPEAFREMQIIIQRRVIGALESELEDIRTSYILKEKPNGIRNEEVIRNETNAEETSKVRSETKSKK